MKRDIDLARVLLLEIEREGADCPINRLHLESPAAPINGVVNGSAVNGTTPADTPEVVRYHLRLLIDAGMVKEIDRTQSGVPCVRLTNSGHELIELARSDARWREAKQYARDSTGGLSLTVIRAMLTKWAVEGAAAPAPHRGYRRSYYRPYYHRVAPRRRPETYRGSYYYPSAYYPASAEDQETRVAERPAPLAYEPARYEPARYDYLERSEMRSRYDRWDSDRVWDGGRYGLVADRYDFANESDDGVNVSLPVYLV